MDDEIISGNKRINGDIRRLINSKHKVLVGKRKTELEVLLPGPKGSLYEKGIWKILLNVPERYPYKSPSVGFMNKIYHPNVDETSGSICLNVINQTWTALYDLTKIFDHFLPQLLCNPNPGDPLNHDAAAIYLETPQLFINRVNLYIEKYATHDAIGYQNLSFRPRFKPKLEVKREEKEDASSLSSENENMDLEI